MGRWVGRERQCFFDGGTAILMEGGGIFHGEEDGFIEIFCNSMLL